VPPGLVAWCSASVCPGLSQGSSGVCLWWCRSASTKGSHSFTAAILTARPRFRARHTASTANTPPAAGARAAREGEAERRGEREGGQPAVAKGSPEVVLKGHGGAFGNCGDSARGWSHEHPGHGFPPGLAPWAAPSFLPGCQDFSSSPPSGDTSEACPGLREVTRGPGEGPSSKGDNSDGRNAHSLKFWKVGKKFEVRECTTWLPVVLQNAGCGREPVDRSKGATMRGPGFCRFPPVGA